MKRRWIFVLSLLVLLSVGCDTAVPKPTLTHPAASIAAEAITLPPRPSPVATATEAIVTETAVAEPSNAPTPKPTFTPTPTEVYIRPTRTPLSLSPLAWLDSVQEKIVVDDDLIAWSPVSNEFIFDYCARFVFAEDLIDEFIFIASAPEFLPEDITPDDFFCNSYSMTEWRPEGTQLLVNGVYSDAEWIGSAGANDSSHLFVMDIDGRNLRETNAGGWLFDFEGWMDNQRLVTRGYRGGGNWIVSIFDVDANEELAWAWIYAHFVNYVDTDFVIANSGDPFLGASAAIFSTEAIRPVPEPTLDIGSRDGFGSYINHLSFNEDPWEILYDSRYQDWISESNQMLVLTWNDDLPEDVLHENAVTNLQMWDVETDQLTLIVPNAIYGRISHDRNFLVYMTPSESHPQLQLLNRVSGEIQFVQPAYAEDDIHFIVAAFTSFSPNGRFLTFYSPTPELMIYDLEKGEFLPPVTAVPYTPLWSPDNGRFVYDDPENGLSIYEVVTQTTYPLAVNGGDRLSNPQWSFDGTYLSVVVLQEDGEGETAVLQLNN